MTIAQAIRAAIPLGIHADSAFLPISDSLRTPSLIPPPASITEIEVRRNTFWLLYAMERMGGCSNGWPMSLDDQDVSQLLPVKGSDFDLEASMILQCRLCDYTYTCRRTCRLLGPGTNGNMLWEKTYFYFTLKTKLTRSICTSKGPYCCRA